MANWNLPAKGGHMEAQDGVYYQNMTTKMVEERLKKNDVLLLPVGSTENHGPSAPYGEDTYLDTRLCELVAERTGCTVAQPIWYGSHPYHHLGQKGTVMIPEKILADYIAYVLAGFWNTGFRKIIIVNGHGQDYVIPLAIHTFGKKWQVPGIILYTHFWNCAGEEMFTKDKGGPYETPFVHADESETSAALLMFPDMVDMSCVVDAQAKSFGMLDDGYYDGSVDSFHRPNKWSEAEGHRVIERFGTPEGVVGYPSRGDARKGQGPLPIPSTYPCRPACGP